MSPLQHICLLFGMYVFSSACMSSLQHKCLLFSMYIFSSEYFLSFKNFTITGTQFQRFSQKYGQNRNKEKFFMFIFFFFCTGYTLFQNRGAAPLEDTLTTAYRKEIVLSIPGQAVNLHVSIVRMQGVRPSCFHCTDAGSQTFMFPLSGCREYRCSSA